MRTVLAVLMFAGSLCLGLIYAGLTVEASELLTLAAVLFLVLLAAEIHNCAMKITARITKPW